MLVRNLFCIVLSHYIFSVRGGWHQLEETVNFLLLCSEQRKLASHKLLRHIFEDLIASLVEVASEESILLSQPCRDNTLYLLKLLDEMLICESGDKLPFPAGGLYTVFPSDSQESESQKDISVAIGEILNSEGIHQLPRYG
ncbi:hypothetical protein Taro_001301 [Colocasia esculenta]|uniref:DUF4704 domain-containing protein n=1 Tax=Colocasia esculenta TaxID=4460 RepID=A0A843T9J6_COLES|nr:hypothetical protein [Colocasia esculenta]